MKRQIIISAFIFTILFTCLFNFTSYSKTLLVPDDYTVIQSAIDAANAHDTVLVKPGTYHEFLVLKDSIVVMSSGTDDGKWNRASVTTIHSEGLRDSTNEIPPVVNCADGDVLDGFEITGMDSVNHHLPGHSHAVQNRGTSSMIINCIVHDNGSTGIGSHEKNGKPSAPTIVHNKVYRNMGIGIGFNQFAKGIASNNVVYENREVGIGIQNGAAPIVLNNTVYSNGTNGISAHNGSKPVIRGNEVYSNGTDTVAADYFNEGRAGIGADSTGWTVKTGDTIGPMIIQNNIVYDNPGGGIVARNNAMVQIKGNVSYNNSQFQIAVNDSSNALVDSNLVYVTVDSIYTAGGIIVNNKSTAQINSNSISNSHLSGIMITNQSRADINDNDVISCIQAGIRIDSNNTKQVKITNNRIKTNHSVGIYLGLANTIIHHNLLVNNTSGGILSDSESLSQIYNNTIVFQLADSGRGIYITNTGSEVFNNIIWGYTVGIFKVNAPSIDYNCTYNNNGYNGPPGTGGQHAISEDPLFVNYDSLDFHLTENSPCINAGNPDSKYNDPDGTRSDIGCYPYQKPNAVHDNFISNHLLQVYPSVTPGLLNIKYTGEINTGVNCKIYIYDIMGNKIDEIRMNTYLTVYNATRLIPGMYFLKLNVSGTVFNEPFIKE